MTELQVLFIFFVFLSIIASLLAYALCRAAADADRQMSEFFENKNNKEA